MKYSDWQDEGGFFHIQKDPTNDGSENGPLFTAEVVLFSKLNDFYVLHPDTISLKVSNVDFRDRYEGNIPAHFSHDNMTGLHCLRALGYAYMSLPIIRWNSTKNGDTRKFWLHPRDIIFYTSIRHSLLSPLSLLLIPFAIYTFFHKREVTSGKCLWFTRFATMSLSNNLIVKGVGKLGLKIADLMLRKEHGDKPFIDVFNIYFKNYGHPCREEIKVYYENLR